MSSKALPSKPLPSALPSQPPRHLRVSDVRGAVQLATQAVGAVTRIVEGVHQSVWGALGVPGAGESGRAGGLTGLVYQSIHTTTRLVGKGLDLALGALETTLQATLETARAAPPGTPQREAVLAALNGVMGDHLAATGSPFAIPMRLRSQGQVLDWAASPAIPVIPAPPQVSGRIVLLIHGLCMNELQWAAEYQGQGVNHGERLAAALGYTLVYLRYNSGLHISQNGRELAAQLETLCAHWPVPVEEICVLAHSMGGLLIRSAVHYGRQGGMQWPELVKHLVFLGTPHHGAPLERAGNRVDFLLACTPFTAPFAALGQLRSAGITDLRYGNVLDEDWQGHDRFACQPDARHSLPLPTGMACYAVAASRADKQSRLADRLIGDGLVPLHSALGQYHNRKHSLRFSRSARYVVYRTSHIELLSHPEVTQRLLTWLAPGGAAGMAT